MRTLILALLLAPALAFGQALPDEAEGGGATYDGGSITNPFLAPDGTVALPSFAFTNCPSCGMWYSNDGTREEVNFSVDGQAIFQVEGNTGGAHFARIYNPNVSAGYSMMEWWSSTAGNTLYGKAFDGSGDRVFGWINDASENYLFINALNGTDPGFLRLYYTDTLATTPWVEWNADTSFPYTTERVRLFGPPAADLAGGPYDLTLPATTGTVAVVNYIKKASDQSTTSTDPVAITGMSWTPAKANTTYEFHCNFMVKNSVVSYSTQISWTWATAGHASGALTARSAESLTAMDWINRSVDEDGKTGNAASPRADESALIRIEGTITTGGTVSAPLAFFFESENVAGTATVEEGSFIAWSEVP